MRNKARRLSNRARIQVDAALSLDEKYRNGGRIVEDRESEGRDLVTEMRLLRSRPDVLANELIRMGIGPEGDEAPDLN